MVNELFELIVGESGLIVTLRCYNRLDEEKLISIKSILSTLVLEWKKQQTVPKKAMLAIFELVDCLVGGNRFLDNKEAIKVEDASLEIRDIINDLYENL